MSEQEDNMEENSHYSPSDEDDTESPHFHITFQARWLQMNPGATRLATSHASDILSKFQLFSLQPLNNCIEMTNMGGFNIMVKNDKL